MITSLKIRNYQSLRKIDLELGKFTVVVGATGSGKSSIVRALRLLFFNARGTSWISRGASTATVAVETDMIEVSISRGGGQDAYVISAPPHDEVKFTKLGGGVPELVDGLLGVQADESGASMNFAGQFDIPYLLGSTGSQVARILGDLTNVTVLYSAAREASRRRQGLAGDLRAAEAEVESLQARAQGFRDLRAQQGAVESSRALLEEALLLGNRRSSLTALSEEIWALEMTPLPQAFGELPDTSGISDLIAQRESLRDLIASTDDEEAAVLQSATDAWGKRKATDTLWDELQYWLGEAGVCPLCGQETH